MRFGWWSASLLILATQVQSFFFCNNLIASFIWFGVLKGDVGCNIITASNILPFLGSLVANDRNAYKYLSESIDLFPNQEELIKILKSYGFENVNSINLFNGIVAIHTGYKT